MARRSPNWTTSRTFPNTEKRSNRGPILAPKRPLEPGLAPRRECRRKKFNSPSNVRGLSRGSQTAAESKSVVSSSRDRSPRAGADLELAVIARAPGQKDDADESRWTDSVRHRTSL
jgi:hypothetical protein